MKRTYLIITAVLALALTGCKPAGSKENNMTKVKMETSKGDITIGLYDETPLHKANFLKLVEEGTYEGTLFHRVIQNFMVQAGDPDSKGAKAGKPLGGGDVGYTIPAEFMPEKLFHKRGALAAARQGDEVNPKKASSGCQFYIVTGQVYNDSTLANMEQRRNYNMLNEAFNSLVRERMDEVQRLRMANDQDALMALQDSLIEQAKERVKDMPAFKFTPEQMEAYTTAGGTPHLDGAYTVFGEVLDGMEVVDAIQVVETDGRDRPLQDVVIKKMTIIEP